MVNVATASLGGFLADIYTWSDTKRPSIVSTPLATATPADAAPPRKSRYWLQTIFRLYFGVGAMWYPHIRFVYNGLRSRFSIMQG